MRLRFFAFVCCLSAIAALNGCAPLERKPVSPPVAAWQEKLYQIGAWRLEGRLAVKAGTEGWNANLFWDHDVGQERLRIFGPFSQGAVSLIVQDDRVYVNEGKGLVATSQNPDEWLKNRFGISAPLHSLRYWVLGLPAPKAGYQPVSNPSAGTKGFEQQGWLMDFEGFSTVGDFVLPRKMSIRGPDVLLKLIVDEWVLHE